MHASCEPEFRNGFHYTHMAESFIWNKYFAKLSTTVFNLLSASEECLIDSQSLALLGSWQQVASSLPVISSALAFRTQPSALHSYFSQVVASEEILHSRPNIRTTLNLGGAGGQGEVGSDSVSGHEATYNPPD